MDLVLVSITAVSLVLAIAMGLIVLKLLREERLRSEARSALLAAATASEPSLELRPASTPPGTRPRLDNAAPAGELFAVAETESPWLRRAGVAAALAVFVAVAAFALTRGGTPPAGGTNAAIAQHPPLELLALDHVQQNGVLTITGTVRNPSTAPPAAHVAASAFLFAPDGTFLTSGRAALDYATLAPGDQSQFVINVPVARPVGRYRVGFRGADGQVVAHVDRRAGESASNAGSSGSTPWVR